MTSELKVTLLETSLACFINLTALCRKYVLLIQAFVKYVSYFFYIAHADFWISKAYGWMQYKIEKLHVLLVSLKLYCEL